LKKGKSPGINPEVGLPYGIKNNELVTIDEVKSGLDCDCFCPACNNKLIAHKGPLVKNSFAHYAVTDCKRGIEAGLQRLCKDLIAQEKRFVLPPLYFGYSWRSKIASETEIKVDSVRLENKSGSPVSDIIIESKGRTIVVEVTVNRRTPSERMQLLKSKNIIGVEIHLPRMIEYIFQRKDFRLTGEEVRNEILFQTTSKFWIHNPVLTGIEEVLKEQHAKVKTIGWFKMEHGDIFHYVDDCPLKKRVWQGGPKEGKTYASVEDCNHCYFCLSKFEKSSGLVYCIGHLKDTLHQLLWKARSAK
jgi:hypothetical protein